jgi:hypothetical protein
VTEARGRRYVVTFTTDTEPDQWRVTTMTCSRSLEVDDFDPIAHTLAEQLDVDGVAIIDCELQGLAS